jgi:hypothetical protein
LGGIQITLRFRAHIAEPSLRQQALRIEHLQDPGIADVVADADYLIGIPTLGDFLEGGLDMVDRSCEDFEIGRL